MAFKRLGRGILLLATLFYAGLGYLCLGQHPASHSPLRPRYVFPFSRLPENVPTNSNLNTSRTIELIPGEYRKRYLKWRNDFLSTGAGRNLWRRYALDPTFTLTITIDKLQAEGGIVDSYHWDELGRLTAATIRLGHKLDSGYPSSINYPITCSLMPGQLPPEVKGTILAAAKIAHEFGHLNQLLAINGNLYQKQNRLMIEYNHIFEKNGRNVQDPRLLKLVEEMAGTPVSIKQERETWAEMGALFYLQERLVKSRKIKMPEPIRQAIEAYYLTYPERIE